MKEACEYVQGLLSWLVNDTLASNETVAVLDHVRSCPVCRRDLAFLVATQSAVEVAWSARPDPALADALWAQMEEQLFAPEEFSNLQRSWFEVAVDIIGYGLSPFSFVYEAFGLTYRSVVGNVRDMLTVMR